MEKKIEEKLKKIKDDLKYISVQVSQSKSHLQKIERLIKEIQRWVEEKVGVEWVSTINIEDEENFEKMINICSDIAIKDETFKFDANRDDREIYLYSEDKDRLHKKSMWLVKKTGIEGLSYKIEKK